MLESGLMVTRENQSLAGGNRSLVIGRWSLAREVRRRICSPMICRFRPTSKAPRLSLPTNDQFRRLQKIVISGRIQSQVAHSPRMHQYVVEIPQIDVRHLLSQSPLDFSIKLFAGVLVRFVACLVNERVHARVGEVAAIGAVRRELGGMKSIFKNVGVFVAADPAQGIKLEEAVGHVGEEGREFKSANIERDSYFAQLWLQHS